MKCRRCRRVARPGKTLCGVCAQAHNAISGRVNKARNDGRKKTIEGMYELLIAANKEIDRLREKVEVVHPCN